MGRQLTVMCQRSSLRRSCDINQLCKPRSRRGLSKFLRCRWCSQSSMRESWRHANKTCRTKPQSIKVHLCSVLHRMAWLVVLSLAESSLVVSLEEVLCLVAQLGELVPSSCDLSSRLE